MTIQPLNISKPTPSCLREQLFNFLSTTSPSVLKSKLPGAIAGLGDYLSPVQIQLDEQYSRFRIDLTTSRKEILNFSRCEFFGYDVDKSHEELIDVSGFGACKQSSHYKNFTNAHRGVSGTAFSCNVHTNSEFGPWWEIEFPNHIRPRFLSLLHRPDIFAYRSDTIRITGYKNDGTAVVLYHPSNKENIQEHAKGRITKSITALERLGADLSETAKADFDTNIQHACDVIDHILSSQMPISKEERQEAAKLVIQTLDLCLTTAQDIGFSSGTAEDICFPAKKVRYIRIQSFEKKLKKLGGLEVYGPEGKLDTSVSIPEDKLTMRWYRPSFHFKHAHASNLRQQVLSRIIDLGKPQDIDKIRLWCADKKMAAKSVFTTISVSEDRSDWQDVFTNWQKYIDVLDGLKLATMLVRNDWPEEFPKLLGKLYTVYRCTELAKPLAKLVRRQAAWVAALGQGADQGAKMFRHAPPLRFTKHGLRVPLQYRSNVMDRFIETKTAIEKAGYTPILLYGTLLGAIREKDFIAHDDDLDVAIIVENIGPEELEDAKQRIAVELQQQGLDCRAGGQTAPIVHYRSEDVFVDIFILAQQGDTVFWPHKNLKVVPERADIFLPTGTIEFKGHTFGAPRDPISVTEARYGKGWRTPEPTFEL